MTPSGLLAVREQDILRSIKSYLELRGFAVFRRNVGGAYNGLRFVRFSEPGQADLYGWDRKTGQHLEVEIKRPRARTNPQREQLQRTWLNRATREGCIAFRAASVEDADAALEAFGYARRLLL